MANTYVQVYYHLIWGTKYGEPYLTEEMEAHLYPFIRHKCAELKVFVHALDGFENHSHLACSLPVTLSIAEFMNRIKGSSSHFINGFPDRRWQLYWQPGYGALTFAKRDLPRVVAYIQNQKKHHRERTLWEALERVPKGEGSEDRPTD